MAPGPSSAPARRVPGGPATVPAGEVLDVAVLKNLPWGASRVDPTCPAPDLPYRIDLLSRHGLRLHATDAAHRRPWTRLHDPSVQTAALGPRLVRDDAVFAMFESSAHPLGLVRRVLPAARRPPFLVLSCWLPELLADADETALRRYRAAYATVDRLYHLSSGQGPLLREALDLPPGRLAHLPYGVDHEAFRPGTAAADGPLLAVGRDRGRDWPTLFAALAAAGTPAQVVCRPADIAGLRVPEGVEVLGPVPRDRYRTLLQRARAVVVTTRVRAYPTGQSVLLEAMACGRPVVATATPALAEHLEPGVNALTVPPGDVDALAEVLRAVTRGEPDLDAVGRAAREAVERSFTAEAMWATVATDLRRLVGERRAG